jgi:hypothetical protein
MQKLSIRNIGKDKDGIKTLKITVDDNDKETINISIPVLMRIIKHNEADEGTFYKVEE